MILFKRGAYLICVFRRELCARGRGYVSERVPLALHTTSLRTCALDGVYKVPEKAGVLVHFSDKHTAHHRIISFVSPTVLLRNGARLWKERKKTGDGGVRVYNGRAIAEKTNTVEKIR